MAKRKKGPSKPEPYEHTESTSPMRPEVGVQAQAEALIAPNRSNFQDQPDTSTPLTPTRS